MQKLNIILWKENKIEKSRIKNIYKQVFDIIAHHFGENSEEATNTLLELLLPLHFEEKRLSFSTNQQYNKVLILLECLFRTYHKYGLLPDACIPDGKINLTHCSIFLAGKETKIGDTLYVSKERIVPTYMSLYIQSIIDAGNLCSRKSVDKDYLHLDFSENLLYGYTLIVCDLLVWSDSYIGMHPNKEENCSMCVCMPILQKIKMMYEGSVVTPEKDNDDNWHYKECYIPITGFRSGFKFRLTQITLNKDNKTKGLYKYYVQQFEKIRES